MAKINLYVSDADGLVIEKLRKKLESEDKSMSEFLIDAAKDYLESEAKPEEIELQGLAQKRIFEGNTLYWREDSDQETGVFLTAKGAIAYWSWVARAINPAEQETFEVYEGLEELFENQGWLGERRNKHIKAEVEREYAALTNRRRVERLDI